MPPKLFLLLGFLFVGWVFATERYRVQAFSPALFLVFLWGIVASTRPVGAWLDLWGFPIIGSTDPTEGNIYDKVFYGPLAIWGLFILIRRKTDWGNIIRKNPFLFFLILYMLTSLFWSSFPLVSFKRWIKSMGTVIMALLVLTSNDRSAAAASIIRWCAYIHIPFSIIMIKYFRHIGVNWNDFSGEASWVGLATSKNTLGQIAAISALYFLWDWKNHIGKKVIRLISFIYILMCLYLLKGAENSISMTSVSVFAVGLVLFWGSKWIGNNPQRAGRFFVVTLVVIWMNLAVMVAHALNPFSEQSFLGTLVRFLGRDMTFTGRTEIWNDIFNVASKAPLIGVGYGAFWIGRIANIPWTENLSWTLGQGHNGYVDTYLQLGWIGLCLLFLFFFFSAAAIKRSLQEEGEFGRLKMIFFVVILFVNITETTFLRGDHYLWLVFLIVALSVSNPKAITGIKSS